MSASPLTGKVTPPDDFQPAIDALGPKGREFFLEMLAMNGGQITPKMLALAADHGRKYGEP